MTLTIERLRDVLSYDPDTGVFLWVNCYHAWRNGTEAGTLKDSGYVEIKIDYKLYKAHRLAWFYMRGEWPLDELDHRDTNPTNNHFNNLRPANRGQNCSNVGKRKDNTSGHKGVSQVRTGKFIAYVNTEGRREHLGTFDTMAAAAAARTTRAAQVHQEFSRAA